MACFTIGHGGTIVGVSVIGRFRGSDPDSECAAGDVGGAPRRPVAMGGPAFFEVVMGVTREPCRTGRVDAAGRTRNAWTSECVRN